MIIYAVGYLDELLDSRFLLLVSSVFLLVIDDILEMADEAVEILRVLAASKQILDVRDSIEGIVLMGMDNIHDGL